MGEGSRADDDQPRSAGAVAGRLTVRLERRPQHLGAGAVTTADLVTRRQ
jgi:hypothetical protein